MAPTSAVPNAPASAEGAPRSTRFWAVALAVLPLLGCPGGCNTNAPECAAMCGTIGVDRYDFNTGCICRGSCSDGGAR